MRTRSKLVDSSAALFLAHPRDDVFHLLRIEARHRRHVAELPVVLLGVVAYRQVEDHVVVVLKR